MPDLSGAAAEALSAITATAEAELAKVDAYWRDQTTEPTPPDPEPPDPEPEPPGPNPDITTVGMSAEAALWDQRLASVGSDGVMGRRIFAKLTSTGKDQETLIRAAYSAGMLPCVSYKVPNVASAIRGDYDTWASNAATFLASFGKPIIAVIWHEPHGDMAAADYVKMQERLLPLFKRDHIIVGPLLNGWLLDRRAADFWSYTSPKLLANVWQFVGIDTYQNKDQTVMPGDRIPALISLLDSKGYPDMRVGVGEYNGFSAEAIEHAGEKILAEKRCRFAYMWNSASDPGGLGVPLEGARLTAYQQTKADQRARQDWSDVAPPVTTS